MGTYRRGLFPTQSLAGAQSLVARSAARPINTTLKHLRSGIPLESHWNPIGISLEVCSPTRRRCLTTLQCAESPPSSSAPAQRMFSCDQMYRYPVWILLTPHSIAGAQPLVARSIAHPVRCRRAEHACRLAWSLCPMTPLLLSAQLASSSV